MELTVMPSTDGDVRVKVVGEINPGAEDQLKQPIADVLGADVFARCVTLDMSDCNYISSSGIGWLLRSHKKFAEQGGKLQLTNVQRSVDEVFRLMRLHTVLSIA